MQALEKQFKLNKGYLKTTGLSRVLRYQLDKLIAADRVYKIRHGLYADRKYMQKDEISIVAEIIPNGIFCLFTAWQEYGFTTTVPHQYHIALHRNTKVSVPDYPPVTIYYWSEKVYKLGITVVKKNGKNLNFYDRERSVCDAVKFRNKVGEDIMQEVIKAYLTQKHKNIDKLMQYAKALRVEKILTPYLKAFL